MSDDRSRKLAKRIRERVCALILAGRKTGMTGPELYDLIDSEVERILDGETWKENLREELQDYWHRLDFILRLADIGELRNHAT